MATTLNAIIAYLEQDDWRFLVDHESDLIVCRGQGANGRYNLEIRLSEDGGVVHLRIPQVVSLGRSPHAGTLLARILELHYDTKLGRFGLDPLDGEIDCEIILPLEDAALTYRQFRRCLGTLLLLVDQQQSRFRAILATGQDPGGDREKHHETFLDQLAEALGLSRETLAEYLAETGEEYPGA